MDAQPVCRVDQVGDDNYCSGMSSVFKTQGLSGDFLAPTASFSLLLFQGQYSNFLNIFEI